MDADFYLPFALHRCDFIKAIHHHRDVLELDIDKPCIHECLKLNTATLNHGYFKTHNAVIPELADGERLLGRQNMSSIHCYLGCRGLSKWMTYRPTHCMPLLTRDGWVRRRDGPNRPMDASTLQAVIIEKGHLMDLGGGMVGSLGTGGVHQ